MLLERSEVYEQAIREAAAAFRLDHEVLMGIAATESSFHPRPSADGGQGLFQITAVPERAEAAARAQLGVGALDPVNQRHNAFVGAATFRTYLDQMRGDPFLALLAYNIGPKNGGLVSIMEQYGARDFVTIQPYLKHLPRDYPVRVLTHALAYRVWKREGRLLAYQEDGNAARVQRLGIPGLMHADA
jgi:soluble lytic murein transglycosylase-like protein